MPLRIAPEVVIPDAELTFTASRSGGPGGQHVNTTSSRVAVRFDVLASPSLTAADRATIVRRLGRRIAADGAVRVVAQDSRSQHANRRVALLRLEALLAKALEPEVPRVDTKVPRGERRVRREGKRRRSGIKRARGRVSEDEG